MILITRPKDRARRTSEILNKLNIPHHVDSLIKYRDVVKNMLEPLNNICLISSTEAVHSMHRNNLFEETTFNNCSLNVIGEQTANLLEELGVRNINNVFQDFISFKKFFDDQNISQQIDYLCSDIITEEAQKLENEGGLKKIILYKTVAVENFSPHTLDLIEQEKINSVLIYSKFTAIIFLRLLQKHKLHEKAERLTYYCLSERIALELRKSGFKDCYSSKQPNQNSLISLLKY